MKLLTEIWSRNHMLNEKEYKQRKLKSPLCYPDFKFSNSKGEVIDFIWKDFSFIKTVILEVNEKASSPTFTYKELACLAKCFDFEIEKSKYEGIYYSKVNYMPVCEFNGDLTYFKDTKNTYIIITFKASDTNVPDNIADQRGEGITYIHGIWENPELNDSIREKIKKS